MITLIVGLWSLIACLLFVLSLHIIHGKGHQSDVRDGEEEQTQMGQ